MALPNVIEGKSEYMIYTHRLEARVHCNVVLPNDSVRIQDYLNRDEFIQTRNAHWFRKKDSSYAQVINLADIDYEPGFLPLHSICISHGYQKVTDSVLARGFGGYKVQVCLKIDGLSGMLKGKVYAPRDIKPRDLAKRVFSKPSDKMIAITEPQHEKLEDMFAREEHKKKEIFKPSYLLINKRSILGLYLLNAK